MRRSLIRWEGVTLTYPGPVPVVALRPTDLSISAGDYVALVGPSGAGKSSTLNLLGLLDRPTAGRLWFDGVEVSTLSGADRASLRARRVGFVFQAFHLLDDRTVVENVSLGLLYGAVKRRERMNRAREAVERVGLGPRAHAVAATLSGGERQRAAIARAVVGRPALLLADEPTGNLDTDSGDRVLDLFAELRDGETTLVVVTHNPQVAARAARVIHVRDGAVEELASP